MTANTENINTNKHPGRDIHKLGFRNSVINIMQKKDLHGSADYFVRLKHLVWDTVRWDKEPSILGDFYVLSCFLFT